MERALTLARKGEGFTSPNPCVGAVIVQDNKILAEGWHKKAGEDHAEIVAIEKLMKKPGIKHSNLELYVTLEPCNHKGKTGPCTEIIIQTGFKKIYVGMLDPFKKVNGRGVNFLRKSGIKVEILNKKTKLAKAIRFLNQPFIKWARFGLPYVTLKAGLSLDGKITTTEGQSQWITSEMEREFSRLERSKADAVVVGVGTVKSDDCELAAHGKWAKKSLLRIIIDRKLTSQLNAKVFRDNNVFVITTDLAQKSVSEKFKNAGINFKSFGESEISIEKLLKFLAEKNIQNVFVEGGSCIYGLFHDAAIKNSLLIDRVIFSFAPKIIGGKNALSVVGGEGIKKLNQALKFEDFKVDINKDGFRFIGILNSF